jgi:hypothetical protein
VPHLMDHKNYVIHYRNLKFLVSLGIVITKVHKVLTFKQKAWLAPYIEFNTEKRKEAKNEFEKDFFKLMNNAVFGKTMENVKNRMQLHLTTNHENAVKWFSKINFKDSKCFNGLNMIEMYKQEIEYNKPVYVGTSVLDLSKLCMMDFHYNVIERHFPGKHRLLYSDTDSMRYEIEHPDIYEWMKHNREPFDLSDSLRPDLKDSTNKKVLGKFKDEMNSLIITEMIALNPKVYSIKHQKLDDDNNVEIGNKKCLKGVSKVIVKKEITHDDYITVLETNKPVAKTVMSIRSFDHQLYTFKQSKTALTSFYDKMVMVDAVNCKPFGYQGSNTFGQF